MTGLRAGRRLNAPSGFLIAGSATRLSLGNFIINRGLRIIPALAVEIVLSALVLGPIFTALPMSDYLSSPNTWHYFTNVLGIIRRGRRDRAGGMVMVLTGYAMEPRDIAQSALHHLSYGPGSRLSLKFVLGIAA